MPLWIVATPIGTLGDCSPRAREVLESADVIAAEDTRTTRKLLSALDLSAPALTALHAHNEAQVAEQLADRATDDDVVLVSDAGTPGISDPGTRLVSACLERDVRVLSVPGPSALASALAASGFPAAPSTFVGFAPRKGRKGWVRSVLERGETVVIYEAPGRIRDLIRRLSRLQPGREATVCRELSKRFEEVRRAPLGELTVDETRGEFVLVIGPGDPLPPEQPDAADPRSLKSIATVLAERWDVPKKVAYRRLLDLEADR